MDMSAAYLPRRQAQSDFVTVRGLRYHVNRWGDASLLDADRPALMLMHGWMDVGASFQFFVDALAEIEGFERLVLAPDWRGFGLTDSPATDTYWFPDYLADLDALLDQLAPGQAVDLAGHSMGGNVVMVYAGLRPLKVRRLINLEGFGMPQTRPSDAPRRLVKWLDELKSPAAMRSYENAAAVAQRLMDNNPLLTPDKAAWLAPHWSRLGTDGRWHILGDPAHKRVNPVLYRVDETLETWKLIQSPVLWVEGDQTDVAKWWGARYTREEFEARLTNVTQVERYRLAPCGHMLHHDQPMPLARRVARFFVER
jgi:pimeloyl-ACP methyl ester carboxylesterase